ncbi:DEAD/DEAH box helicase family protein [Segatella copri]|uniref:DEAD/DEAH box helicase n=1 Tax=Segatella copri TaxID=165179 RepID=UPI002FF0DD6E
MKERIEKALRLHRSVMAQMPTGTGKTVLLASVVESFLREHSNCNVWIVAHRRELVSQIKDTLNKFLLNFSFSNHPVPLSKEGSTFSPSPSSSGSGDVTALRCSEPLRSKVGGPSKVSPDCAGWDRLGAIGASKVSPDCLSASAFNVPIKAVSIQWLSKHYDEIEEEPGMIVIDEAHHALAKTYKGMWDRFPKAKFLGLTATPCRLNGKGFTDLFDVLVQSWSVPEFISKGRLATYDFVSIKSDGVTQRLIDSLQKRGADGDYQNKEMDMLLNKKPSIERLYRSLEEYGKDRKGIVYAINISHANAIAEFYREHGIAAVAIDSKTPSSLRKELIERFKASNTSQNLPFSNHPVNSSKITPSLFTIKEGSTSHPDPLTLRGEGGNRPTRCSEPLRSKDGGPSKVSPDCAGWDRLGAACLRPTEGLGDRLGMSGVSKVSPDCAGWDRLGATCLRAADGLAGRAGDTCLRVADGVEDHLDDAAPIQVLVNVDIFSEGFDCPDVEFVQLARPTLSLAKYLQMVGRGLRVDKGKKNCVIIDNVGLYRVFGLPSQVWNWNAMFEGKLKVGKRKETPKDREFFLMNEKQDDIQIHPDSEMMMVMSHEELLQTIQYREFVDSRGEFAIIKLPDGKMTVVNRQGEQVLEPGDYRDMKLLDGNILFYRHCRKEVCYYDLLSGAIIDDGPNVYDVPKVVTLEGWEFIKYGDVYMSRTYEHFSWPYCPSKYDLFNFGDYLIYRYNYLVDSGCQEWYYYEGGNGLMMKATIDSNRVCFLRGDYEHVYWKCATLRCGCIVVMDSKQDYYLVDSYLKKTYIGCNNPKNENEDLHIVMPRLGKKYYDEMMLQEKKKEASEMILLHEKSVAGHVELYQAGKKWGIKVDGRVVVPPLYRSIAQPVGAYCAFEEIPRYWGIMTLKGKVIVDAKYEKVEIRDGGIAVVTDITGKTQTIHLK